MAKQNRKKKKNKTPSYALLPTIFMVSMLAASAGCIVICIDGLAFKVLGGIVLGLSVIGMVVSYAIMKKETNIGGLQKKSKSSGDKKAEPKAKKFDYQEFLQKQSKRVAEVSKHTKIASDGTIERICQEAEIKLNIWGEDRSLGVITERISDIENPEEFEEFNDSEKEELNWLIKSDILNSDKVKDLVLQYVNYITEMWDDDYYEGKITSILPPEVELNNITIYNPDFADEDEKVIAVCGEAMCDTEHGICIVFVNHELDGIGQYMDYNQYGSLFTGKEE